MDATRLTRLVLSFVACVALVASALVALPRTPAGAVAAGFSDQLVATVGQPMDLDWTPDGRALIPTKSGQVRVMQNGTLLPTPALDLSAEVCTEVERGLGGLAVHPQFATNHYIYLYYTYPKFGPCASVAPVNRLSRFVLPASNVIDPSTELVLLDTPQLGTAGHHNGGDVDFGADGFLYLPTGDGQLGSPAQSLGSLLGKVIRITDDGDIPAGNPYTGAGTARCNADGVPPAGSPAGTKCQEVYASGLRNPFRMVRDQNAATTKFYVNDVGNDSWEEIDELVPGANYGWPVREGPCTRDVDTSCTPVAGFTEPIHWYPHQPVIGGAITGGAFVPPGLWPSEFDGKYLFADYVFGQIYRLDPGGPNCRTCLPPTSAYNQTLFTDADRVVEMGFGPSGSTQALYYVTQNNQIRRITFTGSANRTPTAVATATPSNGGVPLSVAFDGSGSSDPDGNTLTYRWNFRDGSALDTTPNPTHVFTKAGTYMVRLTVQDGHGGSNVTEIRVDVGNRAPVPVINTPTPTQKFSVGEVLTLNGSATDPEDGTLGDASLSWEVRQHHHTHYHPYLSPTTGNNLTVVAPEPEDFGATEDSYLEVLLTATDSKGLSTTVSLNVQPRRVNLTFQSEPSGLHLVAQNLPITTPTTLVGWKGWKIQVEAPDQVDGSGVQRNWTSWSDGGSQNHEITVPASPTTYTAKFVTGTGVVVRPGGASVTEGDTGSKVVDVPVTLNRPATSPVTVDWATVDTGTAGIATAGADYVAASGTVTFAPGETSKTVPITVLGDKVDEPPALFGEWVLLSFSHVSSNATLDPSFFGLGIAAIIDDDPPMIVPGAVAAIEGQSGSHVMQVPVKLTTPSSTPVTVHWTTSDTGAAGVAKAGVDYVAASGTLTFAPGETSKTVSITVFGDVVREPPLLYGEWGLVQFSNPSSNATLDPSFGGLGLFVILDDD